MKKILVFAFLFARFQFACAQCNVPVAPAKTCQQAPVLCDLDGYCSKLPNSNGQPTPNVFCGIIENSHWLAFIAGTTKLSLRISPYNCNENRGMQGHILQTSNCQTFQSVSNCWDPSGVPGTVTPFVLTANNLTVGQKYYLLLDGKGGDVCEYSIEVLAGQTTSPDFLEPVTDPVFFCEKDLSVVLEATDILTPGDHTAYHWTTPDGSFFSSTDSLRVEVGSPGTYTLVARDSFSLCTDTLDMFAVAADPVVAHIAPPDRIKCENNFTVSLTPDQFSSGNDMLYEWFSSDGALIAENVLLIQVNQPGNYVFKVTDLQSGCAQTDTALVELDAEVPIAEAGPDGELNCVTPILTLHGGGSSTGPNFVPQWTTPDGHIVSGAQSLFPQADAPGTYFLTVLNTLNGCETRDSVVVVLNEEKPRGVSFLVKNVCYGETGGALSVESVDGGNLPVSFSVNDTLFQHSPVFDPLPPGDYILSVLDERGCRFDTAFSVLALPEFDLFLPPVYELKLGDSLRLPAQTNRPKTDLTFLQWRPGEGLSCDTCLTPVARPFETITYRLEVTDGDQCRTTGQIEIRVNRTACVYIPNAFSPNGDGQNDRFYPFAIQNVSRVARFLVFDRWGNLVFEQNDFAPNTPDRGWDGTFRGRRAPVGVYTYLAEMVLIDGKKRVFRGTVTLVR